MTKFYRYEQKGKVVAIMKEDSGGYYKCLLTDSRLWAKGCHYLLIKKTEFNIVSTEIKEEEAILHML